LAAAKRMVHGIQKVEGETQGMVKIRLRRVGAKKQPSYRVVVTDSTSPRDGRFIENVGHYNPRTVPETAVLDEPRVLYWLSKGAQPTEAVARMLKNSGILDRAAAAQAAGAADAAAPVEGEAAGPA
jgi:small subunit ribosomal protein S16